MAEKGKVEGRKGKGEKVGLKEEGKSERIEWKEREMVCAGKAWIQHQRECLKAAACGDVTSEQLMY